jgi:hypothetical protein
MSFAWDGGASDSVLMVVLATALGCQPAWLLLGRAG